MAPEIYHEHEPLGTVLGYDDAGKDEGERATSTRRSCPPSTPTPAVVAAPCARTRVQRAGSARSDSASAGISPSAPPCSPTGPGLRVVLPDRPPHRHARGGQERRHAGAHRRDRQGELVMIWGRQDPHIPGEGRGQGLPGADGGPAPLQLARVQRRARLHARRGRALRRGGGACGSGAGPEPLRPHALRFTERRGRGPRTGAWTSRRRGAAPARRPRGTRSRTG